MDFHHRLILRMAGDLYAEILVEIVLGISAVIFLWFLYKITKVRSVIHKHFIGKIRKAYIKWRTERAKSRNDIDNIEKASADWSIEKLESTNEQERLSAAIELRFKSGEREYNALYKALGRETNIYIKIEILESMYKILSKSKK